MLYAGMDTGKYPGKPVMDEIWDFSNIYWTGMYLDSPAPVVGEIPVTKPLNGHNRMGGIGANPVGGWMNGWFDLRPVWGLLPIYWGQQDPNNADGPIDVRVQIAVANAEDAAVKATSAGLPPGSVIYLDWEMGGPPADAGKKYCSAWFHRLAELGYRPGVYCHPPPSLAFRKEYPGLYVWNVNLLPASAGGITIVDGNVQLATPPIDSTGGEAPDRDAIARQWRFGIGQPTGGPISGFPNIDADVAVVRNPAFPESGNQPGEVRGGPVVGAPGTADWLGAFAVRRGKAARVTWSPGAATLDADLDGSVSTASLNPFVQMSALTDWLAGLALWDSGDDRTWHVHTFRHAASGAWHEFNVPESDTVVIDPLAGVVIARRKGGAPELFAHDRKADNMAGSRWVEATQTWTVLDHLQAPAGPVAPFVLRTNGLAALSRKTGLLDLFWVGSDSVPRTSFSLGPGNWSNSFAIGDPFVRAHAMANLAACSPGPDLIEVPFIGRRDGDPKLRLYSTPWTTASLWGTTREIGGGAVPLEPSSRIAATSRSSAFCDVFVIGLDGMLYNTFLTTVTGVWTALRRIGGTPPKLAHVVTACCQGTGDVEVLAVARDGSVWATHWDSTLLDYLPMERLTLLDLA
ncbi:glycoside hydrolase domain-containing protein [Streptomyces sp. NPDC057301]|uniref:glycoside hydrolase domain-containing protein n=1 Tax=Streptomyces sp. NPDC057301 TaxID=3346093 RepID=UPI00363DC77F